MNYKCYKIGIEVRAWLHMLVMPALKFARRPSQALEASQKYENLVFQTNKQTRCTEQVFSEE